MAIQQVGRFHAKKSDAARNLRVIARVPFGGPVLAAGDVDFEAPEKRRFRQDNHDGESGHQHPRDQFLVHSGHN